MNADYQKWAGILLFLGAGQFLIGMMISESIYPNYHVGNNLISDLGVGPAASIFNSSVFLAGLALVASAYLILRAFKSRLFSILGILAGIGAMGVGVFPEGSGLHSPSALLAFLFGGFTVIAAYRLQRPPLSYFSVLLGLISLISLGLFIGRVYLGLGVGGMERMIVYPVLLWAVVFGGYLMSSSKEK